MCTLHSTWKTLTAYTAKSNLPQNRHFSGIVPHISGLTEYNTIFTSYYFRCVRMYKIKIIFSVDRATPFATPAGLHFASCLRRFGSPVICLNLVKKKEKRKRESLLTEELLSSITYLNQFLPPEHHIRYEHKDMARINKRCAIF